MTEQKSHLLVSESQKVLENDTLLQDEIQAMRANEVYREEVKQQKIEKLENTRLNYLDGRLGELVDQGVEEFNRLRSQAEEIITVNRLNDKLNEGAGVSNASIELETIAKDASSLSEFISRYEQTRDPYLRRAYQIKGASLARSRFPQDAANGSFAAKLDRDRAAFYENDETQAIRAEMSRLYDGVVELTSTSRKLYRQFGGMKTFDQSPAADNYYRRADNLSRAIYREVADYRAAQNAAEMSQGFGGGFYHPAVSTIG